MYRITYGDNVIFDPYDEELKVTDASMSDEINAAAYLDFTISVLHPLYDTIQEHDKVVCLYFNGSTLFQGIVYSIESDIQGNKIISCVSAMDYLNDTVVRPYSTVASEADLLAPTSIDGYFQWLIDQHNDHVMDLGKRFEIGINQGGSLSKSNYIAPSSTSYSTTASEISSNIIDPYGGYLTLRYDGNRKILDLYSDVHEMNAQIIDFGVNIVDITKTIDTESQYTALIPQGGSPAVEDGGFESNSYSEWVVHPDTKLVGGQVHQGSHASYFTSGNGEYVNKVVFYAKNGRRYKGTIWVKNERSSDVVVHFGYQINTDGDWDNVDVQNGSLSVPNDGEWHEFSVDFMLNASEYDKIRPRWYFDSVSNDNGKRVYVDDLDFRQIDGDSDIEEDPIDLKLVADGIAPRNSGIAIEGDALYSIDAVREYGYREKVWRDDAITDVDDLLEAAVVQLNKLRNPVLSITVKAIDLSLYMDNYDHLQVGQAVRVRSKLHDLDEYFMVSSIALDLQDPKQTEYTLGVSYDTFTGQQSSYIRSLNSGINSSLDSVTSLNQSVKDQAVQIGSVEQIANDAKDTANNAQNTANSAQQAAQDAQNSASSALDKAEAVEGAVSEIQGMIDDINSGAEQAKQDAAQAKADAQQAAAKADAASQAAQAAANKADALEGSITDVTTTVNGVVQDIEEITTSVTGAISTANEALSAASSASQDLEGFKTTVSQTYQLKGDYATNTDLDEAIAEEVLNRNSAIEQSASSITSTVSQTYATKTDLAVTDGKAAQAQSAAQQAQTSASNAQSTANAANNTANGVADDLTDYMETVATTYASKSELEQTSESITATVEANYTEVKQLANTAQSTADSALSKANEASGELADFTESVTSDLSDLQSQIDGSIATWFYAGTPTLTNEPAVNWTTTEEKNQHLGDLYYDTNNGYAWRFMVQNGSYSWGRITDSDVTKALEDAANAQDTADSKRRVFVSQPTPPYDVGDLWVQGENGDILRCATPRASGSYNASDWVLASKYTDDSALEIFEGQVADIYSTKAELETATDSITATVEENFEKSVLVKEADGGIVDCGDTAGMPLAGLTVYGQTRQNLWANPSGTVAGVTITPNGDGSVTVEGTSTGIISPNSGKRYILKPSTSYTISVDNRLSGSPADPSNGCFFVELHSQDDLVILGGTRYVGYGNTLSVTFTTPRELSYVYMGVFAASGKTLSGTYRVMLNEGSEVQPWCPPGLNSVEDVTVWQAGKNLYGGSDVTQRPYAMVAVYRWLNPNLVGKKVRMSFDLTTENGGRWLVYPYQYTGLSINFGDDVVANTESGVPYHFSATGTVFYAPLSGFSPGKVIVYKNASESGNVQVSNIQIEFGEVETAYEPYAVTSTPIDLLGNKISSLPDGTRDELTVDVGGNVVLRKKTHQQVIVGDDLLYRYVPNTVWITLFNNPILDYEHPYDASLSIEDNAAFSDKIPYYPIGNTGALPVFYSSRIGISTTSQNAPQAVYVNTPLNTTVAEAKEWLNDNPVQFLYALKDPYDIPLGTVDLPDLPETNAHVWISAGTQGLDPDIHATWYGENASALKDFASKAELKVESDQIKATVEETYSTKGEVSAVEDKANAAQDALDSYKETVSTTYATKSSVTQTANSIKQEVSETYTTKADASATYATKTSLSTVEQTVDGLSSTVSSNYKTLNNKFNNYYTKTQVDQKEDAIQLNAQRMAGINYNQAKMLYTDPCFEKDLNGVHVYNNSNNGNVTITRQTGNSSDPFTFSNYRLMIQNKGTSTPGCGGFYFANASRANAVFLYRIWALIPSGRYIHWAANAFGTGSNVTWMSSTAGTGEFEEYVCVATCGSTGEFGSIGFFYIDGAVGTSSSPVTWYVAYATCFDVTNKSDYSTLRVDVDGIEGRVVDAEGNISTLEQTSSGLELRLTQAEKDVDRAQTTANTAQTTASTANTTANAAKTAATNAQTAANNAAKTATNYLKFDSSGLVVGNHTTTLTGNTQITSSGVNIRNGTSVLASFGADAIELGRNSDTSKLTLANGMATFGKVDYGAASEGLDIMVRPSSSSRYHSEIFMDEDGDYTKFHQYSATYKNQIGLSMIAGQTPMYEFSYAMNGVGRSGLCHAGRFAAAAKTFSYGYKGSVNGVNGCSPNNPYFYRFGPVVFTGGWCELSGSGDVIFATGLPGHPLPDQWGDDVFRIVGFFRQDSDGYVNWIGCDEWGNLKVHNCTSNFVYWVCYMSKDINVMELYQ